MPHGGNPNNWPPPSGNDSSELVGPGWLRSSGHGIYASDLPPSPITGGISLLLDDEDLGTVVIGAIDEELASSIREGMVITSFA